MRKGTRKQVSDGRDSGEREREKGFGKKLEAIADGCRNKANKAQ